MSFDTAIEKLNGRITERETRSDGAEFVRVRRSDGVTARVVLPTDGSTTGSVDVGYWRVFNLDSYDVTEHVRGWLFQV